MKCPLDDADGRSVLLEHCAGRLEPEAAAELERHIRVCPACREFAGAQTSVWQALDGWAAPPVSAEFDRRLYARIAQGEAGWWRRLVRAMAPPARWPAWTLAAACAVVVLAFLLQPRRLPNRPADVMAENFEIEQVEQTLEDLDMLRQLDQVSGAEAVESI